MPDENDFNPEFQNDYGEVAENVEPEHHRRHILELATVVILILFASGILAVNMYNPQYAFWKDSDCRYQFQMENTGFDNGEYRVKIQKTGNTPVNATLDAEGTLLTSYDNLAITDQVIVYLPENTESLTVYGQCDRSANLEIS